MAKPKPALFYGVLEGVYTRDRDIMRVTKRTDRQISGVREGDITAITVKTSRLLAEFSTLEAAKAAIERERATRTTWDEKVKEAERATDRLRNDRRDACIAALKAEA